jgi:hypothetical protein
LVYNSTAGIVSLYLDGRLVEHSPPKPGTPLISNGSAGFTIGDNSGGSQVFIGSVDEVEVFNVAFSSSQIKALFDSDSAGKCKPLANHPPECSSSLPSRSQLWPPNHTMNRITIQGITDPDGDPITVTITNIHQDEPTKIIPGDPSPDGANVGTNTAQVRAERNGNGDGRVYHIGFTADDGKGKGCSGEVIISVPHDLAHRAIDSEARYDSTQP